MSYHPSLIPLHHHRQRLNYRQQRGVVIVVALFIVALVATMSYVMMGRLERDTYRSMMIVRDTQAELYAQGSIAWAIDQLRNDWELQKPKQLVDNTPIVSPIKQVDGYQIQSTITDMQGRFNINNLLDKDAQSGFTHLLLALNPTLRPEQANQLTQAVVDWITPGNPQNTFMKYYLQLPIPYRPAHRLMLSPSELLLVKGMTPEIYKSLLPVVTALPAATMLNVQSAPMQVLLTLSPSMSMEAAKSIIDQRLHAPFSSTDQFGNLDVVKNHGLSTQKIVVVSSYFLIETDVTIENQRLVLYTLVSRAAKDKKATVTVLWQSKGVW